MAILEINRGNVRALSILTEEYTTRVAGMQSTNRCGLTKSYSYPSKGEPVGQQRA